MIQNYLKVAWRTLRKHPVYTLVNVFGLGVALATCLLIGLYVQDELSYDTFHPDAHRTLALTVAPEGHQAQRYAPPGFASLLKTKTPGVEHVTRISESEVRLDPLPSENEASDWEPKILGADSSFFDVFPGFPLRRADRDEVLDVPGEVVLTVSAAESMFGSQNPIGRELQTTGDPTRRYTVVGLTEVPDQSTLQFDAVLNPAAQSSTDRRWRGPIKQTYVRTSTSRDPDSLAATLQEIVPNDALLGPWKELDVDLISLPELYLSDTYDTGSFRGQPRYLYIFGSVGFLILLVAGLNYVNLALSQVDRRTREVGVRRVMGARRHQVVGQFLTETAILIISAFGIGLALAGVALPLFNALFGKNLVFTSFQGGWVLGGGLAVALGLGLLAGAYPAFVLSGFRPARTLGGASQTTTDGGGRLQKAFVVAQFAVSAGLIFGTVVIYQQLDYLQNKSLGFDEEKVVTVPLEGLNPQREEILQRTAREHPAVQYSTVGDFVPGGRPRMVSTSTKAVSDSAHVQDREIPIHPIKVDTNYVQTLGLEVIAGRGFGEASPDRRRQGYLLTEHTVRTLGWTPETAIGKPFGVLDSPGEVIGVVENFHTMSLRRSINPVALTLSSAGSVSNESILAARLVPGRIESGLDHLRQVTQKAMPEASFSYTFLDERFDQMYRSEQRLGRIFVGFALIAIVLACMGLFGLASYAVQRRKQEIGIRKALGATGSTILGLLSREYGLLVSIALLLGTPPAYWGLRQWLRGFAYQTDVGAGAFTLTAGLVLLVAGASISYHALRAIRTDPARVLRSE